MNIYKKLCQGKRKLTGGNGYFPRFVFIYSTGATLDGGEPKSLLLIERRDGLTAIINILGWLGM
jgi:hypothetical protein